jgi:two-component system OmpR family sensor kinase
MARRPLRFPRTRWSVRSRILASILLVTALGMGAANLTGFLVQRERTLSEIDARLLSRIDAARSVITGESSATSQTDAAPATPGTSTFRNTSAALEAVLARVVPNVNESSLGIIDGKARFVPGTDIDFHLEKDPAFVPRIVAEVADGSVRMGTSVSSFGQYRYIAAPISVTGSTEVGIYVAAVDIDAEVAEITDAFTTYATVALGALVAVGLVGWFVAGRLLRPIRQLRAAASRITASDRNERIPVVGHDDVSELTATVNDMLDRLDAALTGQRQLLDDVRHELKTPITIVRGHLELLDPSNEADVEATRLLAIDELDRMTGLVDDIESLAETQGSVPVRRQVDVADYTEDVFAKAAIIGGHEWVLSDVAHVSVAIDPARITQAWLQLADNAAKYSPAGSRIELGSSSDGIDLELWIADRGPGIPKDSQERIFERFGRVDTGRGIRGSGLGLPIVRAIAQAHGGRVTLASTPSGSRFGILIPVAGAPAADLTAPNTESDTA